MAFLHEENQKTFSDTELIGADERIQARLEALRRQRHERSREVMPNLLSPLGELSGKQKLAGIVAGIGILAAGTAYGLKIDNFEKPANPNLASLNSPSYPVPKPGEGRVYVARGESESQIVDEAYPKTVLYGEEYTKLINMINRQLPKEDQADRVVPAGQNLELTSDAEIPKDNQP